MMEPHPDAHAALDDFIYRCLAHFGRYQARWLLATLTCTTHD